MNERPEVDAYGQLTNNLLRSQGKCQYSLREDRGCEAVGKGALSCRDCDCQTGKGRW